MLQRHLINRHVGLWVHDIGRGKGAVVKALLGVKMGRQAGGGDQIRRAPGDFGGAGGRIDDLIGFGGEAAVVIEHPRPVGRHHREIGLFPMA